MKPGFFQGKKFPFTPKRRKKSLGSQCNNIIDTRHDLAAFRSKLANVSWLRSYKSDTPGPFFCKKVEKVPFSASKLQVHRIFETLEPQHFCKVAPYSK